MIITAYIDESGTHGPPTMIMSCLVAGVAQWQMFDQQWGQHLRNNSLTYYHAHEMRHSQHEYKGWNNDDKLRFLRGAASITENHTLCGITSVMHYKDYADYYVASERPKGLQLDTRYGLSFRFCLLRIVDIVRYRLGDPDDLALHFVLEDSPSFGDAHRIFNSLKKSGPTHLRQVLKTIIPGGKKEFYGLQGADGGAFHMLGSELARNKPPERIVIPAPEKHVRAADKPWQHYNFIIAPEKLIEFKVAIMEEVARKEAGRKPRT